MKDCLKNIQKLLLIKLLPIEATQDVIISFESLLGSLFQASEKRQLSVDSIYMNWYKLTRLTGEYSKGERGEHLGSILQILGLHKLKINK